MDHQQRQSAHQFHTEIPIRNAVQTVHANAVKAKMLRFIPPVNGIGGSGQGAAADGRLIHPFSAVLQPTQIPQQHHGVSHEMMTEGDGLRPLQVGIAGHDSIRVGFRLIRHGRSQLLDQIGYFFDFVPQIQTDVQRHLIISAPGGVEFFPHIAYPLRQHLLNEHVDILAVRINGQRSAFQVAENLCQPVRQDFRFPGSDNPLCRQHGRMGHAARDILTVHSAVKADGGVEIIRQFFRDTVGSSGPHLCHAAFSLLRNYLPFTIACTLMGRPYRLINPAASA